MGWEIKIEHNRSKLVYLTFVDSTKELGNFLLNFDDKEYVITQLRPTYHDELKESLKFIKKDKNIEFGKDEINKKKEDC